MKPQHGLDIKSQARIIVITGLPGTGKSTLLKKRLIDKFRHPLIIVDPNKEYIPSTGCHVFRIQKYIRGGSEIDKLTAWILKHKGMVKTLVVDESNVVFEKMRLNASAYELVNTLRHNDIDMVAIARRPTDINITISELARERYIFRTEGVNDIRRLNEIISGLGEEAANLDAHSYIHVFNDSKNYVIVTPKY